MNKAEGHRYSSAQCSLIRPLAGKNTHQMKGAPMKRKVFALLLTALLLFVTLLPAQALEIIILDKILDHLKDPTPTPPPPPTPEPTIILNLNPGSLQDQLPLQPIITPAPTIKIDFIQTVGPIKDLLPDLVATPAPATAAPVTAAPQAPVTTAKPAPAATPKPAPAATKKPAAKPPSGKISGAEATSFGLIIAELRPRLSDSWHMFTPLDLSADSTLSYPLIAQNAFAVGTVKVVVSGGNLTVSYQLVDGVRATRDFLVVVPNLDSLQTLNPSLLANQARAFNQPINIAQSFGEDKKVALYINNAVDFDTKLKGILPFDPEANRMFMQNLLGLVD